MILIGLFAIALLAATILPLQSEAVLTALLLQGDYAPWLLVAIASVGNSLGSCINWWLGTALERFKDRKWFPVSQKSLAIAQTRYARYGRWSLLLSWVPFIGDPITVAAGLMKEKFSVFLVLVSIAKTGRYVAIAWLVAG